PPQETRCGSGCSPLTARFAIQGASWSLSTGSPPDIACADVMGRETMAAVASAVHRAPVFFFVTEVSTYTDSLNAHGQNIGALPDTSPSSPRCLFRDLQMGGCYQHERSSTDGRRTLPAEAPTCSA